MLTADNPAQQRNIEEIERDLALFLATLAQLIALEEAGDHEAAITAIRADLDRRRLAGLLGALGRLEAGERRLLAQREAANDQAADRAQTRNGVVAVIGLLLMALLGVAVVSAARAHRRALALAQDLARLATTDALTGIANRRQLMAALETAVARAARSGRPLALAMLDIDHFKTVNDTHGHPAGDEVLRCVAEELRRVGRAGDVLGRFGGEEFAVLMPDTDLAQARRAGERLRAAIAGRTIAFSDGTVGRVTVSAGVALLAGGEGRDHFLSRADTALYEAKADGRNLVRLAA